jgi:oligopeptidase B
MSYRESAEFPSLWRDVEGFREEVLDLQTRAGGSPYCRAAYLEVSPDARLVAAALDVIGSESYSLEVIDLDTRRIDAVAEHVYYGAAWSNDGDLYFLTHDESFRPSRLWRWTPGGSAIPLYEEGDPQFHLNLRGNACGVVLSAASRLTSEEWLIDDRGESLRSIAGRSEGHFYVATPVRIEGELRFLLVTDDEGPDGRVMVGGTGVAGEAAWVELLPPVSGRRLYRAELRGSHVVVEARRDVEPRLLVFPVADPSRCQEISCDVPEGTLRLTTHGSDDDTHIAVEVESRLDPPRVEAVDLASLDRQVLWTREVRAYDRESYLSERRGFTAADGVEIPVTIVRRRSTPLDGSAPCLLYGYGAWETVIEPEFDPVLISLLDQGVVFAHAHVRGGGELGRRWWLNGRMENKKNSFDDFISVAEHLGRGFVDPGRIVIRGRSAGGLLVGGAFSLRPDLWSGVLAEVPFVDPVTTMRDLRAPLVAVELDEWGDPRRARDEHWMLRWSPFDNVPDPQPGVRILATSTIHDSRVSIWEPARWVARLAERGWGIDQVLFRASLEPGAHAVPEGRRLGVRYLAEVYGWALDVLSVPRR